MKPSNSLRNNGNCCLSLICTLDHWEKSGLSVVTLSSRFFFFFLFFMFLRGKYEVK